MKIIDEKGKLFGLINIIDLLVLLAIVAIIVVGASRMSGPQVTSRQTQSGEVVYEIANIRQVAVDSINEGDNLYHYDKGDLIGEIVDKRVEPYEEMLEHEGIWHSVEMPDRYSVYITVRGQIEETQDYYDIGNMQTRVGGQYRLKNKNFTAFGTCFGVSVDE